jgi:hypothetical protein
MKRSDLQKEQVNLQQKSVMRSTPGANLIKLFGHKFTHTFLLVRLIINVHAICSIFRK